MEQWIEKLFSEQFLFQATSKNHADATQAKKQRHFL